MRLSLAVLGLLGATTAVAGCDGGDSDAQTPPHGAYATPEAYDETGAPRRPVGEADTARDGVAPPAAPPPADEPDPASASRVPPTPPPHVNELFRTPGGSGATTREDPPPPPPAPVETTKPAPPPPPPPRPSPRPWGGNDPCPPCGMG